MKKIYLYLILSLVSYTAQSQNISISPYLENTKYTISKGLAIGISERKQSPVESGVFYQNTITEPVRRGDGLLLSEKFYYGVFIVNRLYNSSRITANFNCRLGSINNQIFTVNPGVMVNYKVGSNLYLGSGLNIRRFFPNLNVCLTYNINCKETVRKYYHIIKQSSCISRPGKRYSI